MTIDVAVVSLFAAIIGGALTFAGTWLVSRQAILQQKAQAEREDKRADRLEAKADREKDATARDAARKTVLDQYGEIVAGISQNAAYMTTVGSHSASEYLEMLGATEKHLTVFLATFPDKTIPEYVLIRNLCAMDANALRNHNSLKQIKTLLHALAEEDPRINGK